MLYMSHRYTYKTFYFYNFVFAVTTKEDLMTFYGTSQAVLPVMSQQ